MQTNVIMFNLLLLLLTRVCALKKGDYKKEVTSYLINLTIYSSGSTELTRDYLYRKMSYRKDA